MYCLENKTKSIKNKGFKLFLGVIFDYKLTFEEHIKSTVDNSQYATSRFYSVKSHQYRIPGKTLISLY